MIKHHYLIWHRTHDICCQQKAFQAKRFETEHLLVLQWHKIIEDTILEGKFSSHYNMCYQTTTQNVLADVPFCYYRIQSVRWKVRCQPYPFTCQRACRYGEEGGPCFTSNCFPNHGLTCTLVLKKPIACQKIYSLPFPAKGTRESLWRSI